MKINRITRFGTALTAALFLAVSAFAQANTHVVQVAYVIPKGQTAKPRAAEAIAAIMSIVQRFYLQQLGVTFQLADPLVTQIDIPEDAVTATDWNNHMSRINQQFTQQYVYDKNVIVEIIEGSQGPAGGAVNTVKMTGDFWNSAYDTYVNKPQILAQKIAAFPHELGHAFGLMHSADTKNCMLGEGVDMGTLPNLIMQQIFDPGTVFNFAFHAEEKHMLLDPLYHRPCLYFLGDRPHPTEHLTRRSEQPWPAITGRTANMIEFGRADGTRLGYYRQMGPTTWVEQNAQGMTTFLFSEVARDDWSVYLYDASRRVNIQLDLFTKKVMYSDSSSPSRWQLYTVLNALAKMNGYLVSKVFYTNNQRADETGSFVVSSPGYWDERSPDNVTRFRFREIGRDEWSAYLYDQSRDVYVQLDLFKQQVLFHVGPSSSFQFLYNTLLAQ